MEFKVGNTVRIANQLFGPYGQKGKITAINGRFIEVEMKRKYPKIGESPLVKYNYYSKDLRLVA